MRGHFEGRRPEPDDIMPTSQPPDGERLTTAAGLAAFLDLSPDAVVVVDGAGRIRHANREAGHLFGHDVADLLGEAVEVLVPTRQQTVHEGQRVGFTAAPSRRPMGLQRELYAQRADGEQVPVDISLTPIETDDEVLVAAVVRDLSDRREAEQRLAGWADLFDRAEFGIIVSDGLSDRIGRVNPAAAAMHGYQDPAELVGRPLTDLVAPEEHDRVHEAMARVPVHGRVYFVARHRRADGSTFPAHADVSAVRDAEGTALYRAAYVRDLTEQQAVARLLRDWQQRFHTSVEAMVDPVLFLRAVREGGQVVDFSVDYANEAAVGVLASARGPVTGQRLQACLPGLVANGLREALARVVATGEPLTRDLVGTGRAGPVGSFVVRAARLDDGLVVVLHDVTERQRAEDRVRDAYAALEAVNQQLQTANRQLAAANRHQEQFVSMASHELRTPLTTIAGFAETLVHRWDALDDDCRRQYLDVIQRSVGRQTVLLSDLLDVARIRAGRVELELQRVELSRVAEDAREAAAVVGADVQVDLHEGSDVRADHTRLVQILVNLFTNAAKYGRPPVELTAERDGDVVEIRVRDHGDGVPDDFVPSLFTMFAQASAGDRRTATGTGLGLFIVRELTAVLGGTIVHRRPSDGGAEFVLRLPAA